MGVYRAAIVTENGQNLIAQALANEKPLIFTSAKTSSYSYPVGTDVPALTGLQDVVQSVLPFDSKVLGGNVAQVSVRFDNDGVDQTYRIETIGLYAKIEGGAETLFSVTQATTPDEMPVQSDISPSAYIYNIQHTVQNASQITLTVNPAGTATVQDIMDIETPEFDDSGTVEGISSFPSFLETMKSKMNFFQFFRNLKAGLQFVLHAGQIVNNCVTDNAGLPLSAAQGKVLKDLYTQLYSDSQATSGALAEKAPKSHASTDSIYGKGTTSAFGHLKVSDNYTSSAGAAADGVAASSKALADAYKSLDSDAMRNRGTITSFTADGGWNGGSTIIDLVRTATSGATRKTGILSFQRSDSAISTGTTSSVGTIAKTYAPYTGSTTMAFSGSNGATGTCVIASDGSVKITPYGKAVSQYETITVPIYYG